MKHLIQQHIKYFLIFLFVMNNICSAGCPALAATKLPNFVILTTYRKTVNIGDEFYLGAITSNGSFPKWKSSNSKVASVNTYGLVTPKKAGKAKITAKISGAEASCTVTVKKTTISLSKKTVTLEHDETYRLRAQTSNGSSVTYRSKKTSVASITDDGVIRGEKPGSTTITVMADNTKVTCRVKVKKPTIRLSSTKLKLKEEEEHKLSATTSSGLEPTWRSTKPSVADVDDEGNVYALKPGTTRICVSLDGTKKYCSVRVLK
nr:Ig-like domain-containing protein [Eubacterium sp.]